jgi:hypothetical protein
MVSDNATLQPLNHASHRPAVISDYRVHEMIVRTYEDKILDNDRRMTVFPPDLRKLMPL